MINIQADDYSPCKREVESLTEQEATLFLKLVKLCKDPQIARQFTIPEADGATPMTSSTLASETSSQNNSYNTMQAATLSAEPAQGLL
jgi:hypothetical protein